MPKVHTAVSVLAVLGVLGGLAVVSPTPTHAQSMGDENPKELFEGATRMAMKALELLIKTLPQYEPPVILDNGDILIRRIRPDDKPAKPGVPPSADQDRI